MHQGEILVVDDDPTVLGLVRTALVQHGFRVRTAISVLEAVNRLGLEPKPEAIILDISLGRDVSGPGLPEDGLDLLRWLRRDFAVPVIMLSATCAESVKVLALNWGADDYMTKPFSDSELTARVKAVLRRVKSRRSLSSRWLLGPLTIDSGRHEVTRNGESIDLTFHQFRVLEALARANGRVLSRRQILDEGWGPDYRADERTIDVHVRHLRERLESDPSCPEIIQTVRGVGYRCGSPSTGDEGL